MKENAAYIFTICCTVYLESTDTLVSGILLDDTTYIFFLWK